MTPPIRPTIHSLVDFPWDEPVGKITLRQAIEWFKRGVKGCEPLGMLTALEQKYMNERWAELCKLMAQVQGVPVGMLSYFLGEVAQAEIKLEDTALEESSAALQYEVPVNPAQYS